MNKTNVAYLCLEIGLRSEMKTYCGGLGILAGDTLRAAADLGINMVGVTILYKKGWFKQTISPSGEQIEVDDIWDYKNYLIPTDITHTVHVDGHTVNLKVWKYEVTGITGHIVPLYFLDADIDENPDSIKEISWHLYPNESKNLPDSDLNLRFLQEIVIGIGGVQILEKLGYPIFDNYHVNESHAILATLELYNKLHNFQDVKSRMVFTTHTPLAGAHRKYERSMLEKYLGEYFKYIPDHLFEDDKLNMTTFALFSSKFSNGVSQKHNLVTSQMYPEYHIEGITNGIHTPFWISSPMAEVFNKYLLDWKKNPANLKLAQTIPLPSIVRAHTAAKVKLLEFVQARTGRILNEDVFTIGFARRMVSYKRANLILSDYTRLKEIAEKHGGLQIIFSGKAYPNDKDGENMLAEIYNKSRQDDGLLKIVLLEDYNIEVAKAMVGGVDLWLNNPIVPLEASGTSGMKATLNGIPNYSTLDGWWIEGCVEGVTGWAIGEDCNEVICTPLQISDLYKKLDEQIMTTYSQKPEEWQKIMRNCISLNGSYFQMSRMLMEYYTKAYIS